MDREANARDRMECMLLDTNAKPGALPLSLLKYITNNFSDDQLIGSGGFAAVYKGILRDRKVAVKRLFQELDMDEKNFNREVISLIRVKHKNIVRFLGYCSDTQGKLEKFEEKMVMADVRQRLLCFEFLPNGSLDKHIKDASRGLQWRTRYQIIKGICEGLHYLHQQKIVHLDLKPTNILLDHNMVPKIADFGLSKCFDEKQTWAIISKVVGTQGYMAPEVYSKVITMKSDIYSLGIIITEILTGQKGYLPVENVLKSWNTKFQTSHGGTFLEHVRVCAEIGFKCMDSDPEKRPSTEHIMEKLDELERTHSLFETQPSIATAAAGDQFKSQEQRNKFLVHRLYEALNGRDHAGVQALLVANLEWWFHGPPMHQHMMRMLTGSGGSRFSFAPRSVDAFGYTVITEGGDVQQGVFWVHAWTVGSHGVITQLREYFNTDLTVTLAATGKRIWPRRLPKRHLPGLVLTL